MRKAIQMAAVWLVSILALCGCGDNASGGHGAKITLTASLSEDVFNYADVYLKYKGEEYSTQIILLDMRDLQRSKETMNGTTYNVYTWSKTASFNTWDVESECSIELKPKSEIQPSPNGYILSVKGIGYQVKVIDNGKESVPEATGGQTFYAMSNSEITSAEIDNLCSKAPHILCKVSENGKVTIVK